MADKPCNYPPQGAKKWIKTLCDHKDFAKEVVSKVNYLARWRRRQRRLELSLEAPSRLGGGAGF
jgi:hypothetical protein